jgi:hypothetical protein
MDDLDLESLPWVEGCDPQIAIDRKHKLKVKRANRSKRQRKKMCSKVDEYNKNIPAGSLRKFYV